VNVRLLSALALAGWSVHAAAQETYVLDPVHSQPVFEVRHIGFSNQRGNFGKLNGKVVLDRAAKKGTVDVTIDATSIRTFDARLDAAVKGEKYFNVEKYPTITYRSNDVQFEGDRVVAVTGELTMLGVARPIVLKVTDFQCGDHPFNKKPMCGGEATATFRRSDFGMTTGVQTMTPSDEVRLIIPFEAYRDIGS
jgi:polyisoprenoid-binding protein YceI